MPGGPEAYRMMRQTGMDVRDAMIAPLEARIRREDRDEEKRLRDKAEGIADEERDISADTRMHKGRFAGELEKTLGPKYGPMAKEAVLGDQSYLLQSILPSNKAGKTTKPSPSDKYVMDSQKVRYLNDVYETFLGQYSKAVVDGDEEGQSVAMENANAAHDGLKKVQASVLSYAKDIHETAASVIFSGIDNTLRQYDPEKLQLYGETLRKVMIKKGDIDVNIQDALNKVGESIGTDLGGYMSHATLRKFLDQNMKENDPTIRMSQETIDKYLDASPEILKAAMKNDELPKGERMLATLILPQRELGNAVAPEIEENFAKMSPDEIASAAAEMSGLETDVVSKRFEDLAVEELGERSAPKGMFTVPGDNPWEGVAKSEIEARREKNKIEMAEKKGKKKKKKRKKRGLVPIGQEVTVAID